MKKIFAMAFVAALGLAGCQQELIDPNAIESDALKVYATIEDAEDTKTYLNDKEVYWSSGDRIAVFMNKTLRKRFDVSSESVGSKEGVFVYDSDYIVTGKSEAISNNVAYYPFSEVTCTFSGSAYTLSNVTIPTTQDYAPASFGQGAFPMVAVTADTDDLDFAFKNLCGVLAFQLKGSGTIKSITVEGNSDEILSGKATVTAAYGKIPEISLLPDGSKTVTLDCGETGVALQNDTPASFYIVLPPVSFDNGFTVTVTDASGATKEYSTTKKNAIHRSGILRMPEKEYVGERVPQEGDYIDEYGINHGQGIKIGETVWAPVNCGYHEDYFKYGKLYQWGRKFGQGFDGSLCDDNGNEIGMYYDASLPSMAGGYVSVLAGNQESMSDVFYINNRNWVYPDCDMLWNLGSESDPIKTEFDPCPAGWRVPTYAELDELNDNYSSRSVDENGRLGYWFSGLSPYSELVPQIFLSAAGYRYRDGGAKYRNYRGRYWSSKPEEDATASHLYFRKNVVMDNSGTRAYGSSVRCVQDDSVLIPVENITLSKSSLTLSPGTSETLSTTITPSNANHRSAYWWSENPEVATVDQNGKVTAVSSGTTIVYAMAGMQVAGCEVKVIAASYDPDIYFFDDFGWMAPWTDACGADDSVAHDNPSGLAPNVYTQKSHLDYDGVGYANGGAGVEGYPSFITEFANRGYEDINASARSLYSQKYYLKFGKTRVCTGIKLPAMELEGAEATDVVLSFDWSAHVKALGDVDNVQVVVEIEGDGVCADSQAKISHPISPDQEHGDMKWQNVKVLLKGVNNATRITIRPTVLDNSDGVDQKRWYIDNIKVTKPDSYEDDCVDYIDEYGINHGQGVKIGETVWAPVNCGYHATDFKYGKLYQWGRKYGQGYNGDLWDVSGNSIGEYSDAFVSEQETGPVDLATGQSSSNSNKSYYNSSSPYDWCSPMNDKLWNSGNEENPVKTEYDPCPVGWRVPTYAELDELNNNYSSWTTDDNGQSGRWFSGPNSYTATVPQVFFPAAGISEFISWLRGAYGAYWSSRPTLDSSIYITFLSFSDIDVSVTVGNSRQSGLTVRCVQDDTELIPVSSVTLSKTSLSLSAGASETLSSTITPSNANHQSAHWWSDNPEVASVDQNGNVTAVAAGATTIYAMAGMQVATCEVTVKADPQEGDYIDEYGINHGPGVKIGETVWAPVNCGYHATDFKYGKLYQWGRKYGQGYNGELYDEEGDYINKYSDALVPRIVAGPVSLTTGQSVENKNNFYYNSLSPNDWCSPQDDKLWNVGTEENPVKTEYDPCPDGWRVPTCAELNVLNNNYSSWTTNEHGQSGYWFSGSSSYAETVPQVFFPAAGRGGRADGSALDRGCYGCYWSSRPIGTGAYHFYFGSRSITIDYTGYRADGRSIRCVKAND